MNRQVQPGQRRALRLGSVALAALLSLGLWTSSALAAPPSPQGGSNVPLVQQFSDVPDTNPFAGYINSLYSDGVISGYPCGGDGEPCDPNNLPYYRPNNTVTRAQMSKFVDNIRHLPSIRIESASALAPIYASTGAGGGIAIEGVHSATTGIVPALRGATNSSDNFAIGVQGVISSTTSGTNSAGVQGINRGTNGLGIGVYGSQSGTGYGVFGTSDGRGVYGFSNNGQGVYGLHNTTTGSAAGVEGYTNSTANGATGVLGVINTTNASTTSAAVRGLNNSTDGDGSGVYGHHAGTGAGVYGLNDSTGEGVVGVNSGGGYGVQGTSVNGTGVAAYSTNDTALYALAGGNTSNAVAILAQASGANALSASLQGNAEVLGNLNVTGSCCAAAMGTFKIDHPLAPADQYLTQAAVASNELLDLYNGTVTLDAAGSATITMPTWFQALNTEFRYQLTAVGAPGPNLYIAQEMANNQFTIAGGTAGGKVSWQVTGVRHDPYATQHPVVVETTKPAGEQGTYLHPDLYGQPNSKALHAAPVAPPQK